MIELGHIGVGSIAGSSCSGAFHAFLAGIASHAAMDITPHGEINSKSFEIWTTTIGLGVLGLTTGFGSRIFWGAAGGVFPDLEHVLPGSIRPKRPMFPTHRYAALHSSDTRFAIPAWVQVVFGGAVVGAIALRRSPRLARTVISLFRLAGRLRTR